LEPRPTTKEGRVHPNEQAVRDGFDAFARGDVNAASPLLADDVVWHFAGRNPYAGDYTGKAMVQEVFGRRREETGSSLSFDVHDVLANDDHAVALVSSQAERDGKTLEWKSVSVYHMRDGKIVEAWTHNDDQEAVDQFWS
jgi:ketosteroid isomerase-like protein